MGVSAVIPAYNEEERITAVLAILNQVNELDEIIVVNDGSKDRTSEVARKTGARVIELAENKGKVAAIRAGVNSSSAEIVLMMDADLVGLKVEHVEKLIRPLIKDTADMTVGLFSNGRLSTDLAQKISPYLSGQRAIKKCVLDQFFELGAAGYGLEIALTRFVEKENLRIQEVDLEFLTHVMKEEKLGYIRGFAQRLKMYWEILRGFRLARR